MAHTYIVSSVSVLNDLATLVGSVDAVPVQITFWASGVQGLTPAQKKAIIGPLMLAAAFPSQPVADASIIGTFVQ